MAIAEFSITVRVRHPVMSPEYIIQSIGLEASRKWTVGEQRSTPKGTKLNGINRETYCAFKLEKRDERDLPEFLEEVNCYLNAHKQFLDKLHCSGGAIEYYVFWYSPGNTGFCLNSRLLAKISDLGIDLSIDVVGSDDKD